MYFASLLLFSFPFVHFPPGFGPPGNVGTRRQLFADRIRFLSRSLLDSSPLSISVLHTPRTRYCTFSKLSSCSIRRDGGWALPRKVTRRTLWAARATEPFSCCRQDPLGHRRSLSPAKGAQVTPHIPSTLGWVYLLVTTLHSHCCCIIFHCIPVCL